MVFCCWCSDPVFAHYTTAPAAYAPDDADAAPDDYAPVVTLYALAPAAYAAADASAAPAAAASVPTVVPDQSQVKFLAALAVLGAA